MAVRTALELGAALRARRRAQNLTQAQVAQAAGVSRAFVSELERGARAGAELSRVLAVVRALELSIDLISDVAPSFDSTLAGLIADQK